MRVEASIVHVSVFRVACVEFMRRSLDYNVVESFPALYLTAAGGSRVLKAQNVKGLALHSAVDKSVRLSCVMSSSATNTASEATSWDVARTPKHSSSGQSRDS